MHAVNHAIRLLTNVYREDIYKLAAITLADAKYRDEGDKRGILTLLEETKTEIEKLIKDVG